MNFSGCMEDTKKKIVQTITPTTQSLYYHC
jgi:hypothetical protein